MDSGRKNNIKNVKAYERLSTNCTLIADHIETTGPESGMGLLLGPKSKINTLKTKGHAWLRGSGDESVVDTAVNIDNIECDSLETVNVKGKKFHITGENPDSTTIIVGERNEIDEIISNGKTILENITAKKIASDSDKELHIIGEKNNIGEIYAPNKTVFAENYVIDKMKCKEFIDEQFMLHKELKALGIGSSID